uniref:Large ribosomal subunit protein uL6c n=1 Tax=Plagiogramma staurophorum TaxID=1003089 RepID=A0A2U9NMK2_9STRA|nr:ribosomal protein L6 [Plagiogramma staurophorum]AWT38333.1 ribosomal protein L6 [Plagiogramma staurophorum]
MSRIGKLPIKLPKDVEITYSESELFVKGKFGTLQIELPKVVVIKQENDLLIVTVIDDTSNSRAVHGLYRSLIKNMITGVSKQYQVTLRLQGVGYRATVQNDVLILNLGYSHPININIPEDISVEVVKNTTIILKGCNNITVGLFASKIRAWRKPEPYKGKGILYSNEKILRKAGKSGK